MTFHKLSPVTHLTLLAFSILGGSGLAFAEETVGEKAQSGFEEGVKDTKQEYRNLQNRLCNPKDGDKHCTLKKIKNKLKNARDEVNQEAKETKRKID
jgi:hypothetical protein